MGTQNAIGNSTMAYWGGLGINNIKYPSGFVSNAGSGDVDLYTVPAGKRAYINELGGYNRAGTTTAVFIQIKVSGTYYRASNAQNYSTNQFIGLMDLNQGFPIILEAGESLAVNTAQAGMNLWLRITEFDNNCGMKSPKLLALASGDNILYTVPAGKTAYLLANTNWNMATTCIFGYNSSGSSANINLNLVPNGGSSAIGNQVIAQVAVSAASSISAPTSLSAGDSIVINSSAARSPFVYWTNIMEN